MEIANVWLQSGQPAMIRGVKLLPEKHPRFKNLAYYEEGKQGRSFYLTQPSNKREWILKKFTSEMQPERTYISAIRSLVPKSISFHSAAKRLILIPEDLKPGEDVYSSGELGKWLDGTILMPKVPGNSWQNISQGLRSGNAELSLAKRVAFAHNLAEAVVEMEQEGCAHRDLCHESVFLDLQEGIVYLVDWDSMFHGTLYYFRNTPAGTMGYMPPWIGDKGRWDSRKSWNRKADRFALAILISEFLLVNQESPSFYEGSLYSQEMLSNIQHPFFLKAFESLDAISEDVKNLFEQALKAKDYDECPEPIQWKEVLEGIKVEDISQEEASPILEFDEEDEIISSQREGSGSKLYWILLLLALIPFGLWLFQKAEEKDIFSKDFFSSKSLTENTRENTVPIQQPIQQPQSNFVENTSIKESTPMTQVNSPNTRGEVLAKTYQIHVSYLDNDLKMKIDGQEIILDKKNIASVTIKPGVYNMELSFTTIIFDAAKVQKSSRITSSAQITFGLKDIIKIEIDRKEGIWRQINTP